VASVSGPYTTLFVQAIAIVAAAAVLVMLTRTVPRRVAVPITAAVLLVVVAGYQVWNASGTFDKVRGRLSTFAPGIGEKEKCLVDGGNNEIVPFVYWLAERVPESEDFHYVSSSFDRPCLQFALLPRRMVSPADEARYIVYADPQDDASKALLRVQWRRPLAQRRIEFYTRDFALERRG
jgi:hypothetical protein